MKVLGITGGVGSGKSEVLDYLESRYGAYVCQMDEVAKRLEKRGEICFRKIVDRFGEAVVGTDGELDRKKLGEIVFSDEGKRKILNEIVHPPVLDYVKKDIEKRRTGGSCTCWNRLFWQKQGRNCAIKSGIFIQKKMFGESAWNDQEGILRKRSHK